MMTRALRLAGSLALLTALTACGTDSDAASKPVDVTGSWSQETGSEAKGMTIDFSSDSDELLVHTAPDETGGHDHLSGTYSVDKSTGKVTVACELNGHGKGESWTGQVDGDHLTLTSGNDTLKFHKGEGDHGHK